MESWISWIKAASCQMGLLIALAVGTVPYGEVGREYCHLHTFEAECPEGHVVLIEEAVYGRMALGECVTVNYGHLGCQVDVVAQMDAWCSGRQTCSFEVSDLHPLGNCQPDLVSYLLASWTCMQVVRGSDTACSPSTPLVLTQPHGFLASVVAEDTQRGSENCPWLLRAQPGQNINVTVWNFARARNEIEAGTGPQHARICYRFASLRDDGMEHQLTECEGGPRIVQARLSSSHEIQVAFLFRESASTYYFLLQFDVVGCPTPTPPSGARVRRIGDQAEVTCNFTTESWTVRCEGNRWHGTIGNCSQVLAPGNGGFFSSDGGFPYGILIVVSIGVALGVFFGGILLTLASIYMKRRRQENEPALQPDPSQQRVYDFADSSDKRFHTLPAHSYQPYGPRRSMTSGGSVHDPRQKEGVMTDAAYQQYAPYNSECPNYGRTTPGSSHIYESPKFQRKFNV